MTETYITMENGHFVPCIREDGAVMRLEPQTTLTAAQKLLSISLEEPADFAWTVKTDWPSNGREAFIEKLRREDEDQGIIQDW